jgi:hypothetical protein
LVIFLQQIKMSSGQNCLGEIAAGSQQAEGVHVVGGVVVAVKTGDGATQFHLDGFLGQGRKMFYAYQFAVT